MTTAKRSAKPKPAPKAGGSSARLPGQDSTVIVTTDGERVLREKFGLPPVDNTVIVTTDGKRVKRSDFQEN